MPDDARSVLARLPPLSVHHPIRMKDLHTQWDQGCARILADARLKDEDRTSVVMNWLHRGGPGVRDFVLGRLAQKWARPLPVPATEEQKRERREKILVRLCYTDQIPHLRAVNKIVSNRLEDAPVDAIGSIKDIDSISEQEIKDPGSMFQEFASSIDSQARLEYQTARPGEDPFVNAAE